MRIKNRTITKKSKIYNVDWIRNGFCYRTTTNCDWDAVKDCKRTAKMLGETIKYEFDHYQIDTYIV